MNRLTIGLLQIMPCGSREENLKKGMAACRTAKAGGADIARILMLKGAELVLVPNACPMEINRLSQLRGRAYENMMAIATCNYPKDQPDCNGHSTLFDGVAYVEDLPGSRDTCLLEADGEEGVFFGKLDLDLLRDYRLHEVHGNAYRHPSKYTLLTEDIVRPPFVRGDRRK